MMLGRLPVAVQDSMPCFLSSGRKDETITLLPRLARSPTTRSPLAIAPGWVMVPRFSCHPFLVFQSTAFVLSW
ncbi:hypothetical protein D3C85_725120 [compost metagenome]